MQKILGLGNALVDIMTRIDKDSVLDGFELPKGSMQLVDEHRSASVLKGIDHYEKSISAGGSAANTINGIANLGVETGFIGVIGEDEYGNYFRDDLIRNGIKPLLIISKTESGRAVALVSPDSERTFATYLGAAVELSAGHMKDELFTGYDILHVEGYLVLNNELLETAMQVAKRNGLKISLDLASYNVVEENLEFLKKMVAAYVDIVFANEEEAKAFTGLEPDEALDVLAEDCDIAVVKIGKNGSLVKSGDQSFKVGVIEANSLDTTGAGDLYASGFLYGLSKGLTLDKCGEIGSILSGKVIEVIGAKLGNEVWDEIRLLVKN
jgi:sugar/nucleoside kinase (ribokinase family)